MRNAPLSLENTQPFWFDLKNSVPIQVDVKSPYSVKYVRLNVGFSDIFFIYKFGTVCIYFYQHLNCISSNPVRSNDPNPI